MNSDAAPAPPFAIAVLTVSDGCARGGLPDTAGPAVAARIKESGLGEVVATACVPDETDQITVRLRDWAAAESAIDLVLTVGGTGLGPRDVTPEATQAVLERRHDGLVELMRLRSYPANPRAFLSRAVAGTAGRTLIINLPGSKRGSLECLQALLDVLPHALAVLRGQADHPDDRRSLRCPA